MKLQFENRYDKNIIGHNGVLKFLITRMKNGIIAERKTEKEI